jgi:protein TonB
VEGSIEGGATGGLIGSLMQAVRQAVLPPPPPPAAAKSEPAARPIPRIVMGGEVQEALLTHKAIPVYPPLARQMRIQGEVKFSAIISREGMVQNLTMLYGHPMLVPAAAEAIRQWRYRPTILNGQPHEVVTTIIVTFKLN